MCWPASRAATIRPACLKPLMKEHKGLIDTIIGDFFGQMPTQTYHHLLPKAILTIAQNDAIFVGRGVNLLLPAAFRVSIKASMETRIKNLMAYDGLDQQGAETRIKDADRQSDGFMKELASRINVKYYRGRIRSWHLHGPHRVLRGRINHPACF